MVTISIRIVLTIAFFLAGGICASFLVNSPASSTSIQRSSEPEGDSSLPNRRLTPEQVVECQVAAMVAAKENPEMLRACYGLASPANRSLTGPYQRFAEMVLAPPYDHLGECVSWQTGTARIEQRNAIVLVTSLAADGTARAYRFYLSKQRDEPYKDCWMTESVEALTNVEFSFPTDQVGDRVQIDNTGQAVDAGRVRSGIQG
jgi:hypothetical protein